MSEESDQNDQLIENLEEVRHTAATSISVDGISTSIDQQLVAKQLREARGRDTTQRGRRPVASRINLGGWW